MIRALDTGYVLVANGGDPTPTSGIHSADSGGERPLLPPRGEDTRQYPDSIGPVPIRIAGLKTISKVVRCTGA